MLDDATGMVGQPPPPRKAYPSNDLYLCGTGLREFDWHADANRERFHCYDRTNIILNITPSVRFRKEILQSLMMCTATQLWLRFLNVHEPISNPT